MFVSGRVFLMKKVIAFDVDGTLVNSFEANLAAVNESAEKYLGCSIDADQFAIYFGSPGSVAAKKLCPDQAEAFLADWERAADARAGMLKPYPGIEQLLIRLRNHGFELAVVTGRTQREYRHDIAPLGLDKYFSEIICLEDAEKPKPDKAPFTELMKQTGAKPEEVLYIGDMEVDSLAARAAGVEFVLSGWGASDPDIPCDWTAHSPEDIFSYVCRENMR